MSVGFRSEGGNPPTEPTQKPRAWRRDTDGKNRTLLRIVECDTLVPGSPGERTWPVELATRSAESKCRISDPFLDTTESFGEDPEGALKWYLEDYTTREPFETGKADNAAGLLRRYGEHLASQLSRSGLLPCTGHLDIEVSGCGRSTSPDSASTKASLQQLHWEVLEDTSLWPTRYQLDGVTVCRTMAAINTRHEAASFTGQGNIPQVGRPKAKASFNILLVVSRPRGTSDVGHQLVSRHLVALVERMSWEHPERELNLEILRPPTWAGFRDCLKARGHGYYDLVHLDMHGEVEKVSEGRSRANLFFCKQHRTDPLKFKKDLKSGTDVGKALVTYGIRNVIINACESAKFVDGIEGGSVAEALLAQGVRFVVAMSYKAMDQAVEIFTSTFYRLLLLNNLTLQRAAQASRAALLRTRSRRARHMFSVCLLDYVVPVLYCLDQRGDSQMSLPETTGSASIDDMVESLECLGLEDCEDNSSDDILGRDGDVLKLETMLDAAEIIMVHGPGGCGKTALLKYCAQWWEASGWIKESALVDLSDRFINGSFEDVLDFLARQLLRVFDGISESDLLAKIRSNRYLIVVDSLECLSTTTPIESVRLAGNGDERLRNFLQQSSKAGSKSKIILSSRKSQDPFVTTDAVSHRYSMVGLDVWSATDLLLRFSFPTREGIPEKLRTRQGIDTVRRAAILLEGNPAALQTVAPFLRRSRDHPTFFLESLLYGRLELFEDCEYDDDSDSDGKFTCRFAGTLSVISLHLENSLCRDSPILPAMLAPFWTIIPKDMRYYFWFMFLSYQKQPAKFVEGSYATWFTNDFRTVVAHFQENTIGDSWASLLLALVDAGLLEPATLETTAGDSIECYHAHPMLTLFARTLVDKDEGWANCKFAYVRQFLLYHSAPSYERAREIISVAWNGLDQHEDYVSNMKAMAMKFSLEESDMEGQIKRMGFSVFDVVFQDCLQSCYDNKRRVELLVPLVRKNLARLYHSVDTLRPGKVPTSWQLETILNYSWFLFNLENYAPKAATLIEPALEILERWKRGNPAGAHLRPTQEFTEFQLLFARAKTIEATMGILEGKEAYERNLQRDVDENHAFYHAIRRIQLQNLLSWTLCIAESREEQYSLRNNPEAFEHLRHFGGDIAFSRGGTTKFLESMTPAQLQTMDSVTVGDAYGWAIEVNEDAVERFGNVAKRILREPIARNFGGLAGGLQLLEGADESFASMVKAILGLVKGKSLGSAPAREHLAAFDTGIWMRVGNDAGVRQGFHSMFRKEALTSQSPNGWESIARLHMDSYDLAVPHDGKERDYKKGLTHLDEYRSLLGGCDDEVPKRELCYLYIKYATCYNGLGRVADAARSVLQAAALVPIVQQTETVSEMDVETFESWVYKRFAELEGLDVFMDLGFVLGATFLDAAGLGIPERMTLFQIIGQAKVVQREEGDLEASMKKLKAMKERLQETLEQSRRLAL